MVIICHRVYSQAFDATGINAFVFSKEAPAAWRHEGGRELDDEIESFVDDLQHPVGTAHDVPPGGNRVDAFLDLVNASADPMELRPFFERGARLASGSSETGTWRNVAGAMHAAWSLGRTAFRFYCSGSLDTMRVFEELAERALGLIVDPKGEGSLVVRIRRDGSETIYRLDPSSEARLRRFRRDVWRTPVLHVGDRDAEDLGLEHGYFGDHLIEPVTGLGRDIIRSLGGIQFVDEAGAVRLVWPPA